MTELNSAGQTALRARAIYKKAKEIEARANSSETDQDYKTLMDEASKLKYQALQLEKCARWFSYLDRMELLGKNKGGQSKTDEKKQFLLEVAHCIGTTKREAVASKCVSDHSGTVRKLWRAEGEKARVKLLNFMRNHKCP